MSIGSLFSGIGGIELALESLGLGPVVWQAESDPFCRQVLAKHWPGVKIYEDVRAIDANAQRPDILCGGFPCSDLSSAGIRRGIEGPRSGLWSEFFRVIRDLRPGYVFVENVQGLLVRGMGRVLGDLASIGFDAVWECVPAAAVGAPHLRARVWILAYAPGERCNSKPEASIRSRRAITDSGHRWPTEPSVRRVAHGLRSRAYRDQVRALGNSVVPACAAHAFEILWRRIEP